MIRTNREEYEKINPFSISYECRVRGHSRSAGEPRDLSGELTCLKIDCRQNRGAARAPEGHTRTSAKSNSESPGN